MIKYCNEDSNWYHDISSQEEAEKLLKSDDSGNGSFLVMPNALENGDLILSILYQNEVFHYQIHKVSTNEDPFYSINGTKIFHGVDSIIKYYLDSKNITSNALIISLVKPIKGEQPPKYIMCHGRTNLLHKAINDNDEKRILELLKEENRNINARDQDDLTAAHLACLYECSEKTFKCILKAGAEINLKDSSGNTPLHYACRTKSPGFIKALIDANPDTIHMRNTETGFVPLHDAAKFGNLKAIQLLLKAGAPTMPRTKLVQFPLDLAIEAGHFEIAEYLKRFSIEPAKTKQINWYHGTLDRKEANKLVQEHESSLREKLSKKKKVKKQEKNQIYENVETIMEENENESEPIEAEIVEEIAKESTEGVFLIRQSTRSGYALSLWSDSQVKHFIISESLQHFYLDDGPYFISLENLVEHYSQFSDGLPINLRFPVPPKSKPPLPAFSNIPKTLKRHSQTKSLNIECIPELPEKTNKSPLRYFSHPGDDALKRLGSLFERSPTPSSSSANSSSNQLDIGTSKEKLNESEKNNQRDSSIFASLRFSKTSPKKNFIIDGMRSLRKTKNKLSPHKLTHLEEETTRCKARSIFHDVDDLIRQQQLNDPEFNIRTAQDLMKNLCFQVNFVDPIYKVPTNNRSIDEVDEIENEKNNLDNKNSSHYECVDDIKISDDEENFVRIKDSEDNVANDDDISISGCNNLSDQLLSDIRCSEIDIKTSLQNAKQSDCIIRNSLESNDSSNSLDFKIDSIEEGISDNNNIIKEILVEELK